MEVRGQLHAPATVSGKSFQYPLNRRLVAVQAGMEFREKVNLAVC
jgi:hypothetical protein